MASTNTRFLNFGLEQARLYLSGLHDRFEALVKHPLQGRKFEFVVVDSPSLDRVEADPATFAGEFARAPIQSTIVTLPNLGGDALLLIPRPITEWSAYGHLVAFVRHAPQEQVEALWQTVGATLSGRVGERPVWLSTAGLGVSWLHVRLDSRPKYYRYAPFKAA